MHKSVELKGKANVLKQIAKYQRKYPEALAAAIYKEGFDIFRSSQPKVPVDTGRLRSTGYVTPPQKTETSPVVEIGYGTDYAVIQHERTDFHHTHGEAKYLQKAVDERSSGFASRVAGNTRKNVQGNIGVTPVAPTKP